MLKIPPRWLWFRLPEDKAELAVAEPAVSDLVVYSSNGLREWSGAQSSGVRPGSDTNSEHMDDPERDPVLVAPWNHRGTVEAVVLLSGGGRVKRRTFLVLTGPAVTAPAHQWLVHEPEPLVSGLAGRRVSGEEPGPAALGRRGGGKMGSVSVRDADHNCDACELVGEDGVGATDRSCRLLP